MSQYLLLKNEMLAKSWINWVSQLIEVSTMTHKNNRIICLFYFFMHVKTVWQAFFKANER